jgi:hypothetical protein
LLIFLTPHVAQRPDALQPMSDDEGKGWRLTPTAVQPGTWEEQMRGMRRGALPQTRPAQPTSPVNTINLGGESDKHSTNAPATAPRADAPRAR